MKILTDGRLQGVETYSFSTRCRYFVSFQSQNIWQRFRFPAELSPGQSLAAHYVKIPFRGLLLCGRLPGIEPGTSAPQTEVLPLNYSRHQRLPPPIVMMDKVVAIMAEPRQVINLVVFSILIDMVYRQNPRIFSFT